MKKYQFSGTPDLSKNLSKEPLRNKINYPLALLLLPPIFFSLDALIFICIHFYHDELILTKILELFLHLILILNFFILKKYYMSSMAKNITFLLIRTCHHIILMESEEWERNLGEMRIVINGIKLSYLEIIFFFLFNSPKFFMISLISNFIYIGIRVPTNVLFDYFHLILIFFAVFAAIFILEKEQRAKNFFGEKTKVFKFRKNFSLKKVLNLFPENTIDSLIEGIEEGVVIFDHEFEVIKKNHKFTNLLNKIGNDNPLEVLFGAEIIALKEGTEDLILSYDEKNFTIALSKSETDYRNNDFVPNSSLTLIALLAKVFPTQTKNLNPCLRSLSISSKTTINMQNIDSPNLHQKMQANDIKIRVELFFPNLASSLHIEVLIVPIYAPSSLRFLFILNDTTQNYTLSNMMLQSANKTKAVSYVSHEMRTPLNCIIGMLNMMEPILEEKNVDEFLLPALNSAKFLLNLLNDLLDVAQIQAGTFKLVLVEIELKMLLLDVMSMIEIQAKAKGLLIFFEYDDSIPIFIKSDPNRLRQIITNLLGNALKFTQKGSISLKAALDPFDNTLIHLFVIDNGIGIKEENQKLLFTAFGKVEDGENEYLNSQGVGLGLLISNKLAISVGPSISKIGNLKSSLHPGLNVFSEFGTGTTFRFVLEDRNEGIVRNFTSQFSLHEKLDELNLIQFVPRLLTNLNEDHLSDLSPQLNNPLPIELKSQKILSEEKDISKLKKEISDHKKKILKCSEIYYTIVTKTNVESKFGEKCLTVNKEEKNKDPRLYRFRTSGTKATLFSDQKSKSSSIYKDEMPKPIVGCGIGCPAFLVCDDDHFNIKVLQNFLQVYGLPIETAYHGDNAIEKVKNIWERKACCKSFKLIFMDIEMPQKNGLEAAQEIILFWKEKGEVGCPIIATTGHVEEEEGEKILQSGMREKISKPINHRDLRELVERLLL